ncbi:MAG: lysophospholipid acyltransferase family protein [Rhizobiaceae bacterium]
MKRLWRRIRGPLARSIVVKHVLAWLIALSMRFIKATNRRAAGCHDLESVFRAEPNAVFALWHGQHLLAPVIKPRWMPLVALFSRSTDAELNAMVAQKFGIETVRGSGGRPDQQAHGKGGARALIQMKKALDAGTGVCMIADIPGGTPRSAGLGIITLARISGRPVVPVAIATSRRKVLEKTRDKTTVNLPFGRFCIIFGDQIVVPADAGDEMMEALRLRLTDAMNEITAEAYQKVDNSR